VECARTIEDRGLASVVGQSVTYKQAPIEDVRRYSPELATMFQWFNENDLRVNIPACRVMHPQLMTFEAWLHRAGWDKLLVKQPEEFVYVPVI
jgi:hypothetical protein